jgi:diaminohydroxyphosphoribosylaminopyrimidine deaminase / 5-amino-6-(5-phosphoribosylamino)uracil reductase
LKPAFTIKMSHNLYMQRSLELALNGAGFVAPNPLVGAVLVHNNKIISEGYHHQFGGDHAEVDVLKSVTDKKLLSESTLYINLEPCSHFGKTPPCTNLIIDKGIRNVVIANSDPNPLVSGKGIALLQKNGVKVVCGVMAKQGSFLNRRFFTFHSQKRPYIILKWAQSADGFIAPLVKTKSITWISNKTSRLLVHKWRSEEQAILTGRTTIENDNPLLTTRHFLKKNPIRVVIDPELKLNQTHHIFKKDAPVIVFNLIKNEVSNHINYVKLKQGKMFHLEMNNYFYKNKIQSVIIEGGAITLAGFIKNNNWDEARVFTGTSNLLTGIKAPDFNFIANENHQIAGDLLAVYYRNKFEF